MLVVIIIVDVPVIMRNLQELVNRNYLIGYRFEMRVVAFFRKLGYFVVRSPKSKGLTDVTAIPPFVKTGWYNQTLGIQAKNNGYVKPTERAELEACKNKWQMTILIAWSDNRKLKFRTLDGQEITHSALDILGMLRKRNEINV